MSSSKKGKKVAQQVSDEEKNMDNGGKEDIVEVENLEQKEAGVSSGTYQQVVDKTNEHEKDEAQLGEGGQNILQQENIDEESSRNIYGPYKKAQI